MQHTQNTSGASVNFFTLLAQHLTPQQLIMIMAPLLSQQPYNYSAVPSAQNDQIPLSSITLPPVYPDFFSNTNNSETDVDIQGLSTSAVETCAPCP